MRLRQRVLAIVIAMAVTAVPAAIRAQGVERDIESRSQALERLEQREGAERATREDIDYSRVEGGPVTLAEVLRSPDDVDLNLRYARTQIAEGNLRGAAATLERVLQGSPQADQVRLLYAWVLYRLDSAESARAQLDLLRERQPAPRMQASMDRLASLIEQRRRPTRAALTVGAGGAFHTNANFAPDSKRIDAIVNLFGTPVAVFDVPVAGAEDDVSWLGRAGIEITHDLGNQARDEVYAGLDALANEQVTVDANDYRSFDGRLGLRTRTRLGDLDVRLTGSHFRVGGEAFVNTVGVQLALERRYYGGRLMVRALHRSAYESFDVADAFTAERTGARFDFELGGRYTLAPAHRLEAAIGYSTKRARRDYREYDSYRLRVGHIWSLPRGLYLLNRARFGIDDYDAANPFVSSRTRRDNDFTYEITLTGTLAGLTPAGFLPRELRDVDFSVSGSVTRAGSNIQNFEYNDAGVEFFLSKRFDLF